MKKQIKLIWQKSEEVLHDYTFHKSFVGHIPINYIIAVHKNGDVSLGVLRTNADTVKVHTINSSFQSPKINEYSIYDFIRVYDTMGWVLEKGETPNTGKINGTKIETTAFDIAKEMAQDMFNEEIVYFRKMMKICAE